MSGLTPVRFDPRHWSRDGGAPAHLNPAQFEFLLSLTGFGEVWDALEAAALGAGDRAQYAALRAERRREWFEQSRVLAVVANFRDAASVLAPEVDLSDAAIRAAWTQAEQWRGI